MRRSSDRIRLLPERSDALIDGVVVNRGTVETRVGGLMEHATSASRAGGRTELEVRDDRCLQCRLGAVG